MASRDRPPGAAPAGPAGSARRRPAPGLRRHLAWYHGYRVSGPPGVHRGLPSPWITLIITLDDPLVLGPLALDGGLRRYDALVGGLHTRPTAVVHLGRQSGIQVAVRPLAARALLGVPAGELAGLDLTLDDVLGPWTGGVRERLAAERSWAGRFDVLDDVFGRLVHGRGPRPAGAVPAEIRHAWDLLVRPGGAGVSALAGELGWSPRRLLAGFRTEVGLGPRESGRVARFDRARRQLFERATAGRSLDLARLAAEAGYYDQAHLAREFRSLAGCSPSRLVAEEFRFVQAEPEPLAHAGPHDDVHDPLDPLGHP